MIKNMYLVLAIFQVALIAASLIGIYTYYRSFKDYDGDDPLTRYFYISNAFSIFSVILAASLQIFIFYILNITSNFEINQLENCCPKKY
ncbi:hypothetical protein Hokovirus_2_241 [Hokovirus HKV1]|uniref:Uncharacterized protein n=1 Tax=Hokovirus HKV1 TaxID=1977638 RepID=A0A1V0SGE4_9VIRU|nr:hypothetical protein Hokovirus_2_241 [Hokovirus HKV1]